MDAWSFANGKIFDENLYSNFFQEALEDILDKKLMEAIEKCTQKDENSCLLLEKYDKELGAKNHGNWQMFQENLFDDFIPLCSYATKNFTLKKCNSFHKMKHQQCFTFNETSLTPRLGLTQGLNFLVNFDYPGTITDLKEPIKISLHEPNQLPDIRNLKGKNFFARPGQILDLKISTTISETTESFDSMNIKHRNCNGKAEYGEVSCIMDQIVNEAKSICNCQPLTINDSKNGFRIDTLLTPMHR